LVRTTTTSAEDATAVANQVAGSFGWSTDSFEVTTIGPDWGTSVIKASVLAFLVSLVLIIIYISLRFRDYKMGVTAVVALLHDLILVFGIYALLGREVTPNTIAAILTILGYSLYDTVVVFHRINENMKDESIKCTFMSMANHSINEVLMRSMNTSITSLIPVVAMLLFGGETLKDFALAMTIGLVAGAYSSYAIATPLYAVWKTTEERFARLRKKHGDEVQRFVLNRLPEEAAKIAAAVNAAAPAAATEGAPASGAVATEAAGSGAPSKRAGSKKASSGKTSSAKGASRTSNHHYRRKGR
ncbi:protein translocase subunit SecF, partial [Slackia exigua]|uniref:protein translocase subunit SecF n=1 Tax=Slackia exigua TaxID=84109 RepID=UPI0028E49916